MNSRDIEQWDVDILPQKKWFDFNLKQIWEYRDLLFLFVKRDIISFYKQTIFFYKHFTFSNCFDFKFSKKNTHTHTKRKKKSLNRH